MYEQLQLNMDLLLTYLPFDLPRQNPINERLLYQLGHKPPELIMLDEFYLLWSTEATLHLRKAHRILNPHLYEEPTPPTL